MGMGEVLKEIHESGPMTRRELAEEMDLSLSSVHNSLGRLLKWGFLEYEEEFRKEDGCDGPNSVRVYSLSEKGKEKIG